MQNTQQNIFHYNCCAVHDTNHSKLQRKYAQFRYSYHVAIKYYVTFGRKGQK